MSGIYKQHKLCYIKVLRRRRPLMEHFYSYVDYCIVDSDVNCTMKVESAICEQVVIFLTYQKQKNIYTFVVQEIYPIKTIFCYYGKINTMYKCGLQDNSVQKNLKKKPFDSSI